MSTLLESLAAAECAKEEAANETYRDLVAQLGAGTEDPELRDVQAVLSAAGRTASQLASDVRDYQHEQALRDAAAARDAAVEERAEIDKQIAASVATLEAAKNLHISTCRPLEIRKMQITDLIIAGASADQELIRRGQKNWVQ